MNIAPDVLRAQVLRALDQWPFIVDAERNYDLPPWLLFAVGSRETNLTNEIGDNGHGHGVWQLDDRSHIIPPGFDSNVELQATTAAKMLHDDLAAQGGNIDKAACVYNSGQPYDQYTTGGDYGRDVAERQAWCEANLTYPTLIPWEEVTGMLDLGTDAAGNRRVLAVGAGGNTPTGHLLFIRFADGLPGTASVIDITDATAQANGGWELIVSP
jgi:hypothetical protein